MSSASQKLRDLINGSTWAVGDKAYCMIDRTELTKLADEMDSKYKFEIPLPSPSVGLKREHAVHVGDKGKCWVCNEKMDDKPQYNPASWEDVRFQIAGNHSNIVASRQINIAPLGKSKDVTNAIIDAFRVIIELRQCEGVVVPNDRYQYITVIEDGSVNVKRTNNYDEKIMSIDGVYDSFDAWKKAHTPELCGCILKCFKTLHGVYDE